jgi:hypothetical protein
LRGAVIEKQATVTPQMGRVESVGHEQEHVNS